MRSVLLLLPILGIATVSDNGGVTLHLSTRMVTGDTTIFLTCKVDRNPANRLLQYGFADYTMSDQQLNGDDDRPTHGPFTFKHVPCGVGPAFCVVSRNDGSRVAAKQPIESLGECQP